MGRNRPLARTRGLVTEKVDGEFHVYDEAGDTTCVLNATAAAVWAKCDGKRTVKDLVRLMSDELGEVADEDLVLMALDKLAAHGLLLSGYQPRSGAAERLSRRLFFRRAGIASATAMAAPVVYSMAVPDPAFGYSMGYVYSDRRLKRNIRTLRGRR